MRYGNMHTYAQNIVPGQARPELLLQGLMQRSTRALGSCPAIKGTLALSSPLGCQGRALRCLPDLWRTHDKAQCCVLAAQTMTQPACNKTSTYIFVLSLCRVEVLIVTFHPFTSASQPVTSIYTKQVPRCHHRDQLQLMLSKFCSWACGSDNP